MIPEIKEPCRKHKKDVFHRALCAIITVMNMCDLDFMEGYKPCFWTSVVCTGLGILAVLIVLIIFPGLAV